MPSNKKLKISAVLLGLTSSPPNKFSRGQNYVVPTLSGWLICCDTSRDGKSHSCSSHMHHSSDHSAFSPLGSKSTERNKPPKPKLILFTHVVDLVINWSAIRLIDSEKSPTSGEHLLESGHLGEGRLGGLQVAGSPSLHFGRRLGTAVRVAAVILRHGLDVAAAAHPPARDLVILGQRGEASPVVLRHLHQKQQTNGWLLKKKKENKAVKNIFYHIEKNRSLAGTGKLLFSSPCSIQHRRWNEVEKKNLSPALTFHAH